MEIKVLHRNNHEQESLPQERRVYSGVDSLPKGMASEEITPGCLVLEGGAWRGMYTQGALDALMEAGINFQTTIGVSAGAMSALGYLAGKIGWTAGINLRYRHDPQYCGSGAMKRDHGVTGFSYLYKELMQIDPMDRKRFEDPRRRLVVTATDLETGEQAFFEKGQCNIFGAVRASATVPYVSRPVVLHGRAYLDGGCACRIPYDWALQEGFEHIVVIRTRDRSYRRKPKKLNVADRALYSRRYPAFAQAQCQADNTYNDLLDRISQDEQKGRTFVLAPSQKVEVSRFEGDMEKLGDLYYMGYHDMQDQLPRLKQYLQSRPLEQKPVTTDEFFERVLTVRLSEDRMALDLIDQTLLPGTEKRITIHTKEDVWEAIKKLRVRGAPAIGVSAAYGLAVNAVRIDTEDTEAFLDQLHEIKEYLATSRPTAVNLFWALNRMEKRAQEAADDGQSVDQIKELLYEEADQIREEDVQISRRIGELGFGLLQDLKKEGQPVGILTHCNAGTLATAKYGTATAPMYLALEHGWQGSDMHVYCDETRPLLQGARLTSFELSRAGITTTVQCDNMASILMKSGRISIIFVGCDRVAANGDAANKIGTSGVAILAKHYGIPFYVCAPSSTIDMDCPTGEQIPIEMRDPEEISTMWYKERMVPQGVDLYNPAFDVTDHTLITGIITEKGICSGDYEAAFRRLGIGT